MAPAQRPTVVFAGVKMLEVRTQERDRSGDVSLFDVGVKGVDSDPDPGMTDRLAESLRLLCRPKKKRLGPIHGLNGKIHLIFVQQFAECLKCLDRPRPFIRSGAMFRKISNGSVEWAA